MVDSTRRDFLIGAGATAAAAISLLPRQAQSASGKRNLYVPADLRPLIDREREGILKSMAQEDIPGAAVCLVYEGKPVWIEGFGVTDRPSGRKVGDDTIFSIQSTSKNFTATAVMVAVQRGLLELDEPIATYLPDFTVQSRFEAAPERRITLRLLLSHRAGLTHEAPVGNNFDPGFPNFEAHVRSISQTWLRYPVGERYRYSNLGVDLAGYILQTVCKMSFPDCLENLILDPLGMADTTADTEGYVRRVDRAVGHEAGYPTVPLRIPLIPSGGVYTSARDMAAYLIFHINKGRFRSKPILEEHLWNEMHGFRGGCDYGLGVERLDLQYGDTPVGLLSHDGGGFGFGCRMDYIPEARLGWVALFNRAVPAGYRFGGELLHEILSRRYGALGTKPRPQVSSAIEPQRDRLAQFVGNYIGRARDVDVESEEGRLVMRTGAERTPLQFTSPVDVSVTGRAGSDTTCHYSPSHDGEAAHFECSIGDLSLDYNDGPDDAAGPNDPSWTRFLGAYEIYLWGQPNQRKTVHLKNGYLYLDDIRLVVEYKPGLFFTSDGEAVDFRHAEPTWRNIPLKRTVG